MFIEDKRQTIASSVGAECLEWMSAIVPRPRGQLTHQRESHSTPAGFGSIQGRRFYKHFTPTGFPSRVVLISVCCLFIFALFHLPPVFASDLGEFLGKRVTRVDVVIEGAPNANVTEIKSLLDVAAGQDYSPVRIHDSLVRLHRSGLVAGARVEGTA